MDRLVEFPRIREAPRDILGRLRAIDPNAELLYWGPRLTDIEVGGRTVAVVLPVWLLGVVQPNAARRGAGARMVELHEALGAKGNRDAWQYGKLLYQSFAPVSFYPMRDPTGAIVEDFRKRDWIYRHQFDEIGEAWLSAPDREFQMRVQQIQDKTRSEGPGIWRFACAGRRSVTLN